MNAAIWLFALLQGVETPGGTEQVRLLSATAEKPVVRRGEVVHLLLELEIATSWYTYPAEILQETGAPITFELSQGVPAKVLPGVKQPPPKLKELPELTYQYLDGRIKFELPVWIFPDAKPGDATLSGKIEYQVCDPFKCIPGETPFSVPVRISDEPPVTDVPPDDASDTRAGRIFGEGFLAFLLAAMGSGLVSLVMPCVFPLIPITVSYFVKQGEKTSTSGIVLSSAYAAGIVLTFTAIGFLMSLLLGPAGALVFAANPYVNLGVAALFFYFAFGMFGFYRIGLPTGLTGGVTSKRREGAGGAFVLGCLFSVVTFTCTVPFAANLLVLAAKGHAAWSVVGMLVYSGTMAAPFFLLGFFPALIRKIPRAGGWMETVERTVAFLEIALASFYLSKTDQTLGIGILSRKAMVGIWVAVSAGAALYLLVGVFRGTGRRIGRTVFALGFLALAFFLGRGLSDRNSLSVFETVLPPRPPRGFATLPPALELAKKEGKPVFVEFTGVT